MKYFLILLFLITINCSSNKVVKNHGVLSLDKKSEKLMINKSNKNDVIKILGPPSTISSFDNNLWIYIETRKTNQSIFKLGKRKINKNNVLVVVLNNRGLVKGKEMYDLDNMQKINFSKDTTKNVYDDTSTLYSLLSSLREKINAPVKNRRKK